MHVCCHASISSRSYIHVSSRCYMHYITCMCVVMLHMKDNKNMNTFLCTSFLQSGLHTVHHLDHTCVCVCCYALYIKGSSQLGLATHFSARDFLMKALSGRDLCVQNVCGA